jgi:hypothetical protein
MGSPSPTPRELARRLLDLEAARPAAPSDPHLPETARVCEKLRIALARLAGPDGFAALMRRAVALARADSGAESIVVKTDGTVEGLEAREAGEIIIAHLLELLVTFIGRPLTMRVVRQIWPEADDEGSDKPPQIPTE